jgi:hypothetical protein
VDAKPTVVLAGGADGFLERAPEYDHAATIPRLLVLVTRKQT